MKLHRNLISRGMVRKTPVKMQQVRALLSERVGHKWSEGQALFMVSREVFVPFLLLHVGKKIRFAAVSRGVSVGIHSKSMAKSVRGVKLSRQLGRTRPPQQDTRSAWRWERE